MGPAAPDSLGRSEARWRLVQELTGLADFEAGPDGVTRFSARFVDQLGLPPGTRAITNEEWFARIHPDDRPGMAETIASTLESGDGFDCEFRIVRADSGEVRWISSRTRVERDAQGRPVRSIGAHLDITERRAAEHALRESEERFRLAAEAAALGVWDYDMVLDRREWSGRLREIFGFAADLDATLEAALACIHPEDRARVRETLDRARATEIGRFEDSFRIRRANDGAERWVAMNGWRTDRGDSHVRRILMTMRDVTAEKTAEERIRWSASHDPLTRLANRALFQEQLDLAIDASQRGGNSVGVLLLDMDHFKQINDSLGHDAGDMLLKMFAKRLRSVVRARDTVARFGGDEFAVILPELDDEATLLKLAQSVQERLREPFIHAGRILDSKVSIGASLYPARATNAAELVKSADIALYAAKAAGRGRVMLFEAQMRDEAQKQLAILKLARSALGNDRIIPYYQPKLALGSGALDGFEALLRWRTPGGRIAPPTLLAGAFEDQEVAADLSDRMIDRVIADMRRWLDLAIPFGSVALNASAPEFRGDHFAERLLERLHQAQVPPHCVQLEVTENVFLGRGADFVQRALALLSSRGVKIALDDFGTGHASLRHLKQYPVDFIKIDRSFVRDMETDPGDAAIVRAVINLGRSLGIHVVAEGIERAAQAAHLLEWGCDSGQGYLFSRAVAAAKVPALVERWSEKPARRAA